MLIHIYWGIIVAVMIILCAVIVPAVIQFRKTTKSADEFIRSTEQTLTPLLSEIKQSAERLNSVSRGIEGSVRNLEKMTDAIGHTGTLLESLNNLFKKRGLSVSVRTSCFIIGIKTAMGTLVQEIIKRSSEKERDS